MRNIKYLYLLVSTLVLPACTEEIKGPDVEKNRGNEVSFNVSAASLKGTRTYYGSEKDNAYPIFWSSDDRIVVASPMGMEGRNNAPYSIIVPTNDSGDPEDNLASYAEAIVPTGANGVQWGDATNGSFYAIYPYCAQTLRRPNNLEEIPHYYNRINLPKTSGEKVTARAYIEEIQRIWNRPGAVAKDGLLQMYGSNHSLVMWARTDNVTNGESVNLRFKPLSTCLMMTFSNEKATGVSSNDIPAMIQKIEISTEEASTPTYIAGKMTINFPDAATSTTDGTGEQGTAGTNQIINMGNATINPVLGSNAVADSLSKTITILPWIRSNDGRSGIHPSIAVGEKMQVCAFLLPQDYDNISEWTITVTVNGTRYRRKLSTTNSTIKAGEVNKIEFPAFQLNNEWNYNAATWMNDIDDNTYLSQLTFPGSWYSYCQDQSSKESYQSKTFAEQMALGVRAFDISTRSQQASTNLPLVGVSPTTDHTPIGVAISGTGKNYTINSGSERGDKVYYGGEDVKTAIDAVCKFISESAPTETAVIVLTYEEGGEGGHRDIDYQYWLYGLSQVYNSLTYKNVIYGYASGESISAETTLDDVRGRVILKINLNDAVCSLLNTNSSYQYNSNNAIPALISYSPTRWVSNFLNVYDPTTGVISEISTNKNYTYTSLTTGLFWKIWDEEWGQTIVDGVATDRPQLFAWNFSCTNRTYNANSNTDGKMCSKTAYDVDPNNNPGGETTATTNYTTTGLASYWMRQNALDILKKEANDVYDTGYHNELFLFGCGGTQATSDDSTTDPIAFAQVMNPWLNNQIKNIFASNSPTPLGIVFFNQVGNSLYQGDEILTNLIKMNNAFYLQQKPTSGSGSGTTQQQSVKSASPNHASGYTTSNGWSVF